ncbi:MAG: GTPase Era [Ruminococcaceae bacterium]|nr:GTPase Era [Oscillospiraceae bacterium]
MDKSFKSGYVGIVGVPNVGKSTLLNKLAGQKIAIISSKPQTTRNKILAIATDDDSQMVFLDTPGFHKPKTKLGESMIKSVNETISDVDLLLLVVEPDETVSAAEQMILDKIGDIPAILVINKLDTEEKLNLLPVIEKYNGIHKFEDIIPVSASTGDGVEQLREIIKKYLPEGPMYYPDDMVTDQSEKQIVAEIIREKALRLLNQEVPHGIAVEIIKMKNEGDNMCKISANIYCEKESHKRIIIGAKGSKLKAIGTQARSDCEKMLDRQVFLQLWVKVKDDWRNSEQLMREFGMSDL